MKLRVLDEAEADAIEAAIFENEILVLAVSHGSRDQDYWKGRVQ